MSARYKAAKRTDYKAPDFTASSIDLTFELSDDATRVTATARYLRLTKDRRAPLVLDGEKLKLSSVSLDGGSCKYREEPGKLIVEDVPDEFELTVENVISPATNTSLMGLYKSDGVYCTQCEPEGFRRITYFLDRPDVLARYRVTIIGPEYGCGVLLSNGNLVDRGTRKGREFTVWEDPFPKPSYLFALVAGTFDIISDTYRTKSGRRVRLGVYVNRGAYERGLWAMQSIKDAMKWDEERFGLEYDLDNFKVVAVDFFNQGAMENKGLNIFNSVYVMVDPDTASDSDFFSVQNVIGHEYFHNYTGDRVTLRDWFQLSLKESLTVFRDQEFSSDTASRTLARLRAVSVIRGPQFAEDASPVAHPVRPEEVMEMNNFYTVTIYDKGAEVIRMIHTLIGEQKFREGLKAYLEKYDGQAVTIEDFVGCMAEASGRDFEQFFRWYTQAGTPLVKASWKQDGEQLVLTLSQSTPATPGQKEKKPFLIPVKTSFLDSEGHSVHPAELGANSIIELSKESEEFRFTLPEGCLPVLLEDFSAPVRLEAPYTAEDRARMLRFSDDAFIKSDSCAQLQISYVHDYVEKGADAAGDPLDLIGAVKGVIDSIDQKTDLILAAKCMQILPFEDLMQTFDSIDIDALAKARAALLEKTSAALVDSCTAALSKIKPSSPRYSVADMGARAVCGAALFLLAQGLKAKGDGKQASEIVQQHFKSARCMTELKAALTAAVHLSLDCAPALLKQFESRFSQDPLVMDTFFRIQATAPAEETVFTVRKLLKHKCFDLRNPNRVRALVGAMARGNPVALHRKDGAGYTLLCEIIRQLDPLNDQIAASLVTPLLSYRRFDSERSALMEENLQKLSRIPNISRSLYEKIEAAVKAGE
jgi:aminopeptidase N